MKYSIIIGAFAEEDYIGGTLDSLHEYLSDARLLKQTEVIVVVADSEDKTKDIVLSKSSLFKELILLEPGARVGKGRDIGLGFAKATGDYQVFMDADMATPLYHLGEMLNKLEGSSDVVVGIRNLSTFHDKPSRRLGSKLSNLAIRVLAVKNIRDTQCGFKGFTKKSAKHIFSRQTIEGWGFDIEVLAIAQRSGMKVNTMNIPDWKDPKGENGLANDSQMSAMLSTLHELVKVRLNIWQRRYK